MFYKEMVNIRLFILLVFFLVCLITGCTLTAQDVIDEFKVPENSDHKLNIVVLIESSDSVYAVNKQLVAILDRFRGIVQSYPMRSMQDQEVREKAKVLGINTFPTYLLLDRKGIVIQTDDVNEFVKKVEQTAVSQILGERKGE